MATRSKPKQPTPKQEAANENTSQARLRELAGTSTELARIVAKNSHTDPELLRELGSSSDTATRKGVVANPNTPSDVLLRFGGQFPEQLLNNPVFPLLILENPNLLADMPVATLRSLLKRNNVPEEFLNWAANHSDEGVLLALTMNPNTPKSALEKLILNKNSEVAEAAKLHVSLAGEEIVNWNEVALEAMKSTRLERNQERETRLWKVGAISKSFLSVLHENVRYKIASDPITAANDSIELAQNPNLPINCLEKVVEDKNKYVREAAIANPNLPGTIQTQLEPLNNPNTSTNQLEELANSQWTAIREKVALHPNTTISVLEKLAQDKTIAVRLAVAQNSLTPANVLDSLVEDEDNEIATAVAANPNTPVTLLEELAQKKNKPLQEAAVRNLFSHYPDKIVPFLEGYLKSSKPSFTRLLVFLNPHAPSAFLAKNFRSSAWLERYAIAQNPNTPTNTLKYLIQDGNWVVRAAAKANLQQRS